MVRIQTKQTRSGSEAPDTYIYIYIYIYIYGHSKTKTPILQLTGVF